MHRTHLACLWTCVALQAQSNASLDGTHNLKGITSQLVYPLQQEIVHSNPSTGLTSIRVDRILHIGRRASNQRPHGDSQLHRHQPTNVSTIFGPERATRTLTPHSEKHNTVRPSGAHSAFTRPSEPASILAFHVSSRSLNTHTTPVFAHAPRTYSESHDHPACEIHAFDELSLRAAGPAVPTPSAAEVGEGVVSTSQVRAIWNESERRTIKRSCTAVRRKWVPGLNATSEAVCLYISVKSIAKMKIRRSRT